MKNKYGLQEIYFNEHCTDTKPMREIIPLLIRSVHTRFMNAEFDIFHCDIPLSLLVAMLYRVPPLLHNAN